MNIFPAIDVIDGSLVRLFQGDFSKKTIYNVDLQEVLDKFITDGASHVHLIDLTSANNNSISQKKLIIDLLKDKKIFSQVGGGIKNSYDIENLLNSDINRIIVGSPCVLSPKIVKEWLNIFGSDQIVLALDVYPKENGYFLATNGWKTKTETPLFESLKFFNQNNLNLLCTDISKDGGLNGPNFELYRTIKQSFPNLKIQASGGISSYNDLSKLQAIGVDSAIVGKALYENHISLREVFNDDRYK